MSYQEAIQFLESLVNYEKYSDYPYKKSIKLERIASFLKLLGNPQDSLKCIHVAGTKGKGSTCAFIAYVLKEAGFKAGLYTSPHLSDFRERIRLLMPGSRKEKKLDVFEGMISKASLAKLVEELRPAIKKFNAASKYGALTFFESYTALAFLYFKQVKADFVVLETGLGGRLDATNAVSPLVCALAPISYEHTDKLGKTLKAIATEKSGIIKEGVAVICAPQEAEAKRVIVKRCSEKHARLYLVGKDIRIIGKNKYFDVFGSLGLYKNLRIKLIGRHQIVNAGVALGAIEILRKEGFKIDVSALRRGLVKTLWPGRCEICDTKPVVILDGAQNAASCKALKDAIKGNFKYKRLILVLGISNDKDIKGISAELNKLAQIVVLTRSSNPRASDPFVLKEYFKGKEIYITNNIREARLLSKKLARKDDLILVTGSLFVVGEFRDDKRRFN